MGTEQNHLGKLSRRTMLRAIASSAAVAGGATLAGCGREENGGGSGGTPTGASGSGTVSLFTNAATPQAEQFYDKWLATFTEETGIEVNLQLQPNDQYGQALQLSFQSGDAADVFHMVQTQGRLRAAYNKGWLQPLDEFAVVTDTLEQYYPDSARQPYTSGLHVDEQLYALPALLHKGGATVRPLMVNKGLLEEYGFSEIPQTFTEVTETAAAITQESGGDVFGFAVVGGSPYGVKFQPFQNTSGTPMIGKPLNFLTGRSGAADESFLEAIAFLRGIVEDGSMAPGWQTMTPEAFRQSFAQERVAMVVIPAWWATEIGKANADIRLGFASQPYPDAGREGYTISVSDPGVWASQFGMTRDAQNPEGAAQLIAFFARPDVQQGYYEITGQVPALAESFAEKLSAEWQEIIPLSNELIKQAPNPAVRNSAAADVLNTILQNTDTVESMFFEAVDAGADYESAAQAYDENFNTVIDEAIADAEGTGVTAETFKFPDWNPLEDYVTEPG